MLFAFPVRTNQQMFNFTSCDLIGYDGHKDANCDALIGQFGREYNFTQVLACYQQYKILWALFVDILLAFFLPTKENKFHVSLSWT